ncbi:MAG: dihydropteroate synthase, partial [Anaerolineales bacterium]
PAFLNQVVQVRTSMPPTSLLARLKEIESQLGRQSTFRYGPRQIDLDLLDYGGQVIDVPGLEAPHPRMHERAFVLVPLAELAPDWIHPIHNTSVEELLTDLNSAGILRWKDRTEIPLEETQLIKESMIIGQHQFSWGSRTYIMAILNATPDSFSGDGLLEETDPVAAAVAAANKALAAGANILDIGGESTRPGSAPVEAAEEMERVLPVIEAIRPLTDVPISIDTYQAEVAEAALEAGADMVNYVWGLRADPAMAQLVAEREVPVVLMHNRMAPKNADFAEKLGGRYVGVEYNNLIEDIRAELQYSLELAHKGGVKDDQIILDPGIGFGKTVSQNLELLDRTAEIRQLGYPVLLGPSRKSFIGYTLDLPPEERMEGTAATVAIGIARGADIMRVHDVKKMARVAAMTDGMVRRKAQSTER